MDFCILLEDLKKSNAKFLSLKEQFDTSTAAGEMMVMNMMNLAQFERKQTSERVSMNFHARAMRGLRNGGSAILGYDIDPTNPSKLIVNTPEDGDVRKIFQTFIREGTLSQTVRKLEADGIKPKRRINRAERHNLSGKWTTQSLLNVLRNPAYIGLREVNAKYKKKAQEFLKQFERYQVVKASWDALIDEATFTTVQNILDTNLSMARQRLKNGKARVFLLSGIIYCADCERPMVGSSGHGRMSVHRYYTHHGIRGEAVTCSMKSVRADDLEQSVLNHVDEMLFREGYLDSLQRRLGHAYGLSTKDTKAAIKRYESDLIRIEKEIYSTIKITSEMGDVGIDKGLKDTLIKLTNQKSEAERQLEDFKTILESAQSEVDDRKAIELNASELKRAKSKATPAMLKRLIQKLFSGIAVSDGVAAVSYWKSPFQETVNPNAKIKKAPEFSSGAVILFPLGKRKLVKIQTFEGLPPLPFRSADLKVMGGYIIKNGGLERNEVIHF